MNISYKIMIFYKLSTEIETLAFMHNAEEAFSWQSVQQLVVDT